MIWIFLSVVLILAVGVADTKPKKIGLWSLFTLILVIITLGH